MQDLKKTHCCFFESDDQVDPKCIALTQAQFDKIDDYIEYNEILWGYVNLRINCKSNHFKIAMFNLLLIALFTHIYKSSISLYCGVNSHPVAVLTTKTTLSLKAPMDTSFLLLSKTEKS